MASPIDRDPLLTHVRGRGGRLYASCRRCRKTVDLDLSQLIADLGALTRLADVEKRLRCRACRKRSARVFWTTR
jgi:hypothetical protein